MLVNACQLLAAAVIYYFMKAVFKAIYNHIPFKKEIFSALKIIWTPEESIFRHLHFKGIFSVQIDTSRKFKINHYGFQIENEIFWRGLTNCWEKESIQLWIKLCKESQTILDIGANTGVYSLIAKTVNPKAKVYSFEPHPMFFKMLQKNIALNNFDIVSIEKAISNSDDTITIDDYSGHSSFVTVKSISLDTFIKQNSLTKIDLIKIDVETCEPKVLEGFSNYLPQFRPTMIIEIINGNIADQVYNFVRDLGYLYFNIDEKGSIRQTERIERSDYYNYLLCNPDIAAKLRLTKNGL